MPNRIQRRRTKSVEQVLYEAFANGRGVRLTAEQVSELVGPDDAICTRITNAAGSECGIDEPGVDCIQPRPHPTWAAFKKYLKEPPHA